MGYGWTCNGDRKDKISFSVNKPLAVTGFTVFGSCDVSADVTVDMKLIHQTSKTAIGTKTLTVSTDGSKTPYPVRFDECVDIQPGVVYTVSAKLHVRSGRMRSWFGVEGQATVSGSGEVTFTFTKSEGSTNGTNTTGGQIPGILYKVLV